MAKAKEYNESSITVLEGLESVRKKPGMYLGERGNEMAFTALREVMDNAIDERLANRNDVLEVFVDNKKNNYIVGDAGVGIPVGIHKKYKISTLTLVLTRLHAGGKLSAEESTYKSSRGCFVGSTKIKLLNGTSVSIEDLYTKWVKDQKKFWVYSFDTDGELAFMPRRCTKVHLTKNTKKLCDVTLDNGRKIRCTPDHPFLTFEGRYVEAKDLKEGQRLRALYTSYDKDGYELHSNRNPREKTRKGNVDHRTQRTVMKALGHDIEGAVVHHHNAIKTDNRPKNLEVIRDKSEHFWEDYSANGKHRIFVNKNRRMRMISSKNLKRVNKNPFNGFDAQEGKIIQCAARSLRDYKKLTPKLYEKCRGWCYPAASNVDRYFTWQQLEKKAKSYLQQYGDKGRVQNGGQGLNYKLQSRYKRSPEMNISNHFVKKVRLVTLEESVPVYDLTVEGEHNYLLDEGVFVHNTHGVGVSATNAVSDSFKVWTCREKIWYHQAFSQGKPVTEVVKQKPPTEVTEKLSRKYTKGTIIQVKLDQKIVSGDEGKTKATVDKKALINWLKNTALMIGNINVVCNIDGFKKSWKNTKGIGKMLKSKLKKLGEPATMGKPFIHDDGLIRVAMQWADYPQDDGLTSYVNALPTAEGGEHINGFVSALSKAIDGHKVVKEKPAKKNKKGKSARGAFSSRDLMFGLVGVFNIDVQSPEFNGQLKNKLTSKVAKQVEEAMAKPLKEFFEKNKGLAQKVIKRAKEVKKSKEEFAKLMKGVSAVKAGQKGTLPPKLVQAKRCKPAERELYVIEGDSAAGCFVGNTKVQLLNGVKKSFKKMVEEHAQGIEHYGYAHSNTDGKLHVVKFDEPRIVKHVKKLVKVTLDNGEVIKCTLSHPWKLKTGAYVSAKDLESGDSLMPHYERINDEGRRQVCHPSFNPNDGIIGASRIDKNGEMRGLASRGGWESVFRLTGRDTKALRKVKKQFRDAGIIFNVHHKDFDVWNDLPENLEVMDQRLHRTLHVEGKGNVFKEGDENTHLVLMRTDPKYRKKVVKESTKHFKEYWSGSNREQHRAEQSVRTSKHMATQANRDKISKTLKEFCSDPAWRKKRSKDQSIINNDPVFKAKRVATMRENNKRKFLEVCSNLSKLNWVQYDKQAKIYMTDNDKSKFFKFSYWRALFGSFSEFKQSVEKFSEIEQKKYHNHKVKRVEIITLKQPVPVYDATVPKFHNYALAAGVYVHNTAKMARNTKFQECYPLTGKILNAIRAKPADLLKSKVIRELLISLGYDFKAKGDDLYKRLRVQKGLYLLADPDVDGLHINVLLLALIWKQLPGLFDQGKVFICNAPLYSTYFKGNRYYGENYQAVAEQLPKGANSQIIRSKGWGELAPETLEAIAFEPKTRYAIQVKPVKGKELNYFLALMGSDTQARKALLGLL